VLDGGIGFGLISLHQVDPGQELIGGIHALVVLAGNVHKHGQTCAGTDEHGLKALFFHQLVDGNRAAHHGVGGDGNAQSLQPVHFLL